MFWVRVVSSRYAFAFGRTSSVKVHVGDGGMLYKGDELALFLSETLALKAGRAASWQGDRVYVMVANPMEGSLVLEREWESCRQTLYGRLGA